MVSAFSQELSCHLQFAAVFCSSALRGLNVGEVMHLCWAGGNLLEEICSGPPGGSLQVQQWGFSARDSVGSLQRPLQSLSLVTVQHRPS